MRKFRYCSINRFIRGLSEVQMLAKLNHPNIVSYKAAWLEPLITFQKLQKKPRFYSTLLFLSANLSFNIRP